MSPWLSIARILTFCHSSVSSVAQTLRLECLGKLGTTSLPNPWYSHVWYDFSIAFWYWPSETPTLAPLRELLALNSHVFGNGPPPLFLAVATPQSVIKFPYCWFLFFFILILFYNQRAHISHTTRIFFSQRPNVPVKLFYLPLTYYLLVDVG